MKLSEHFELDEFLAHGDPVKPTQAQIDNLQRLCSWVLEPLRKQLGRPLGINSGFRSPAYNIQIGGAPKSQHCQGIAADIAIGEDAACLVAAALASKIPAVGGIGIYPGRGFIHVDIRPKNGGKATWWCEIGGKYQPLTEKIKSGLKAAGALL